MALQIWMPMVSDFNNQGLQNSTITNNSVTLDNNGKLGKCGKFTGSNYISGTINLGDSIEYTLACWVKPPDVSAGNKQIVAIAPNSGWANCRATMFYRQNTAEFIATLSNGTDSLGYTMGMTATPNVWQHIAVTFKNKTMIWYSNGVVQKTLTTTIDPKFSDITAFGIGSASNGAEKFTGYINDVRIYDTALSPKEIEILSRGLVCHYPLNGGGRGGDNIMPNSYSMQLGTSSATNGVWRLAGTSNMDRSRVQIDGNYYAFQNSGIQTANDGSCYGIDSFTFEANTTYTMSMSARITAGTEGYAGFAPQNATIIGGTHTKVDKGYSVTPLTTSWKRLYITFTTNSLTARNIYIGVTTGSTSVTTQMALVKIEKGDKSTPWMPNPADSAYSAMGYNSTTEYDVSGNRYNGTKNGTFAYDVDTPRYSVCTKYSGSNYSYVTSPSSEIRTIAFWAKWDTIPSGQSILFVDGKSKTGFGLASNGIICSSNSITTYTFNKSNLVANVWYHFVVVCPNGGSNTARKLYINGVEQTATSNQNYWSYSTEQLQIGKRSSSSDGLVGKMSDFRAYATALSATQVAELYNTAVSVANNGTLMGYELVES